MKQGEKYIRFSELTTIQGETIQETRREVSPPGFEPVVRALKKKGNIKHPYAVAWSMRDKGYSVKAALAEIEGGKGNMKAVRARLADSGPRNVSKIKLQSVNERAMRLKRAAERTVREMGWTPEKTLVGLVKQCRRLREVRLDIARANRLNLVDPGRAFREAYRRKEPIPSWRDVGGRTRRK